MNQLNVGASQVPPSTLRDQLRTITSTLNECLMSADSITVSIHGNGLEKETPCEPTPEANSVSVLIGEIQVQSVTLRNKLSTLVSDL